MVVETSRQRLHRLREGIEKKRREAMAQKAEEEAKKVINTVRREELIMGKARLHPTHNMHHKRGIVWCWGCGAYAGAEGKNLLKPCQGKVSRGAAYFLNRLREGKTPRESVCWPCAVGEGPPEGPVVD